MEVMYDKILGKLREGDGGSTPGGNSFRVEIVDTAQYATLGDFLKSATGENGVVYLYPNGNPYGENTYTELLWVEDDEKFEIIDRDIAIDSTPTSASPNPVSSGGVYTALLAKADKIPVVDLSAQTAHRFRIEPNKFVLCGTLSGQGGASYIFLTLPATDNNIANKWMWTFTTGNPAPEINWQITSLKWANGVEPNIVANTYYQVKVMDGLVTVVGTNVPTKLQP